MQRELFRVNNLFSNNRTHHCQSFYYNSVLLALTGIQIRQHRSGQIALNGNPVRASNLMIMVTVLGHDWYDVIRLINRHLFREYFFF